MFKFEENDWLGKLDCKNEARSLLEAGLLNTSDTVFPCRRLFFRNVFLAKVLKLSV